MYTSANFLDGTNPNKTRPTNPQTRFTRPSCAHNLHANIHPKPPHIHTHTDTHTHTHTHTHTQVGVRVRVGVRVGVGVGVGAMNLGM